MAYDSVVDYVQHVGRLLKSTRPTGAAVLTESMQTHWALQSTKRVLGQTKQRARPIMLAELRSAFGLASGGEDFTLAFRVIGLTAWFAAMRLGQLLPHAVFPDTPTMRLSDLVPSSAGATDKVVLVTSGRSKTNLFRAKMRTVSVSACTDATLCLWQATTDLLRYRAARGLGVDIPLAALHPRLSTFEKFVTELQNLIPARQASPFEKGAVSGHSFRRGFTKSALEAGFSIEQIMLHGDWTHPDSVLNSYAAGAVLPSIPMARYSAVLERGASSFVSPVAGHREAAEVMSTGVARAPAAIQTRVWSPANPFVDLRNVTMQAQRAAQWEFDNDIMSGDNPFDLGSEWGRKRAREWELKKDPSLLEKTRSL